MSAPIFLMLSDDRLMVKLDSIVAIEELGEDDIDPRTGRLALGVPEGAVSKVITERATFYTRTTYDELADAVLQLVLEDAS